MTYPAKIFFIACSCAAASVAAETLYKSVNEKGEITFSDNPPENADRVQEIQVQPAPTESQVQEGLEREKRIKAQATNSGADHAAREQAREEQTTEETPPAVEAIESYNRGNYYNRDAEPPKRPVRPLPSRPVQLPARPVQRPAAR